jgi:hypothetical protein
MLQHEPPWLPVLRSIHLFGIAIAFRFQVMMW